IRVEAHPFRLIGDYSLTLGFTCDNLGLAGTGTGLSGITGATCGGNSLSCIGPTALPTRRSSSCGGSSGRPGCSDIAGRLCSKGIVGGGGAVLVVSLGGIARGGLLGSRDEDGVLPLGGGGRGRFAFPSGCVSLVTSGFGCRLPAGAGLPATWEVLFAAIRCWARTGGGGTGFPGTAACFVGLTVGCGVISAPASCWALIRTTW